MIDSHDLMHQRQQQLAHYGIENWLDLSAADETAALAKADAVLAIQEPEAHHMNEMLKGRAQVCLVKHAIAFRRQARRFSGADSGDRAAAVAIGFLGSSGKANQIGLLDFIENCWPQILAASAGKIVLRIGGGISADAVQAAVALPGQIEFLDRFEDVADFYSQIDLAINPALISSGLKIKSLECLAYSVPLVTTSAGIVGLERAIGRCADVADGAQPFAESVLRLASNQELLERYSNNCQSLIETEFAPEVIYNGLRNLIQQNRKVT